jgi:hypothetical protein
MLESVVVVAVIATSFSSPGVCEFKLEHIIFTRNSECSYRSIIHTLAMYDIGRNYCELRKNNRIQKSNNNCYSIHYQINIM